MNAVNTEFKNEDVKYKHKVNTKKYYRGEEDSQKTIKTVYFSKK